MRRTGPWLLALALVAPASTAWAKSHCRVVGGPGHKHMDCSKEKRIAQTPSGHPEAVFASMSAQDVGAKIAARCMDKGWLVVGNSPTEVRCSQDYDGLKGTLTQLLLGNAYSTQPKAMMSFNLVQLGPDVRVQGRAWVETQMPGGQVRTQELDSDDDFNTVERALLEIGGRPPPVADKAE